MICLHCLVSFLCLLETGKKFSPTDRNKASEAVKKVINNEKRSGARGIFTTIAAIISGMASLIAVLNQLS